MGREKSRDISIVEFLECLIREYFQADMRAHVYTKRSDKNYWRRTAAHKRDKIEDITSRNRIPNIFEDQDTHNKYYDKFYPLESLPTIIDDTKDLKLYYSVGSDVTIHSDGKVQVGRVESVDYPSTNAQVRLFDNNLEKSYPFASIRRIL